MRDRLIELLGEAEDKCGEYKTCKDCIGYGKGDLCGEYLRADHLLANGVIVPPLKLGQICYKPYEYRNEIDECRVSSITQKADGSFKTRLTDLRGGWVFEITTDGIGKDVYLTKEEAEKELERRADNGKRTDN